MTYKKPLYFRFSVIHALFLLMLSLVVGSSVFIAVKRYESKYLYASLQSKIQLIDVLYQEWTKLQLEKSTLLTDIRVDKIARNTLDMDSPPVNQRRVIQYDSQE